MPIRTLLRVCTTRWWSSRSSKCCLDLRPRRLLRGQARSPRYGASFGIGAVPVGAGLPAKKATR
ncbi:hypothetical protein F9Z43_16155 [Pseudomonas monteilii]|uniref:Uncharacterized protein n=1 Tax=Pseudomonas monteilii TaxID=76759 RepID=A0A7X3F3V7_9PSED|nr:hypothetical protein [Pseudomonas monteilii]